MNRTRMLVLATMALALSVIVTFMIYKVLRNRLRPPDEMSAVVVVTERVSLGNRLTRENVRLAPWPKAAVLAGSFQDVAAVMDRGVIVPMEANEPVLESRLASKGAGAGLTTAIPEGMRAVSIRVNDVIGVAGFVIAGTRVDVILTGSPIQGGSGAAGDVAKTILENVQVLAAGQNIDSDANGRPQSTQVVTLLVTPEDSQKLALASTEGRMQLALRNPLDTEPKNTPVVHRASLYTDSASAPAAAPVRVQAPVRIVKVLAPPPPAPVPVPPPAPPVPPQKQQVQLIQGKTSETFTFAKLNQE